MNNIPVVRAIFICPVAGQPMERMERVEAIPGRGLKGDRYASDEGGSWNKGRPGHRQVTLINGAHFENSGFDFIESRRNLITHGMNLMDTIDRYFTIDEVLLYGVKYCVPCERPSVLAGKEKDRLFDIVFAGRGGIVANIIKGGTIKICSYMTLLSQDFKPRV